MTTKPSFCQNCPINNYTEGYIPLQHAIEPPGTTLLVGEAAGEEEAKTGRPFCGPMGSLLNNVLGYANIPRKTLNVINTIGCRPHNNIYPTDPKWHHTSRSDAHAAVEYCRKHHLQPAIDKLNPRKIIAVGDQALTALTNRKGILVWRGSALPLKGDNTKLRVVPTLHPSYLVRDFKMLSTVVNDLKKPLTPAPEYYNLFANAVDLQNFTSPVVAFDFEWDHNEDITICGISDRFYHALVGSWNGQNVDEFKRIFETTTDLIGHNIIGADTKYFTKLGWNVKARLHDTMVKQHLVQPDMKHGLGFVGSVFTNKMFWKGKGIEEEDQDGNIVETKYQWRTWDQATAIPRELGGYGGCNSADEAFRLYNARDTDGSFQINTHLDVLLRKYGLEHLYWNVALPIGFICRDISDQGIRIANYKIPEIRTILKQEIEELERTLPDGLRPIEQRITRSVAAPSGVYKTKSKLCKGSRKSPHDAIVFTFHEPGPAMECSGCGKQISPGKLTLVKKIKIEDTKIVKPWSSTKQVLAYAKAKGLKSYINRKRGTEAADVNARAGWGRIDPAFRIIDKIKDRATELNTFAKASLENEQRVYFRLNPTGTNEGRLSSAGQRKGIDPNIQNQPKSIRKIYIPDNPETDCFIELDYASAENMLTAWLAKDWVRLERLRQSGYSEHLELGKAMFNIPNLTKSDKELFTVQWVEGKQVFNVESTGDVLYNAAKVVNHGGNYGMGWQKLQEELEAHGFFYSAARCKAFIKTRQELNPETARWQNETMERAAKDGMLRNPFGRIRWFSSRSAGTQALAFLPASTLADIIIRAMIAHYPTRFSNECINLGLQITGELETGCRIAAQVHDSLLLCGPDNLSLTQAQKSATIMRQPWKELDGFSLDVEVKKGPIGGSWGDLVKINL